MGQLNQFTYVNKYYNEYLEKINEYSNYTRHSLFCIYLNISKELSIYNNLNQSNYSSYENGIKFNSFELTPIYRISPIVNNTVLEKDKTGHQFSGDSQFTIYTISHPNKNDLIILPYDTQSNEIYRVSDVSASLNTVNTNKNYYFNLTLEYAPMKNLNDINIVNNYVYALNIEKYLIKEIYIKYIQDLDKLNNLLSKYKFDSLTELYYIEYNNLKIANLDINNKIYQFINKNNNIFPIFTKTPYGVKTYKNGKYYNITNNSFDELNIQEDNTILKLIENIEKYERSTD
jgi:hypothetical protein